MQNRIASQSSIFLIGTAALVTAALGVGKQSPSDPVAVGGQFPQRTATSARIDTGVRVFGANDLGMHCMDREYSIFSILPPFNVVLAQVVDQNGPGGNPRILTAADVDVTYSPVYDPNGSINSLSLGKTDFWTNAEALFGLDLEPGEGLTGLFMPRDADAPGPQPLEYDPAHGSFVGFGIPITPTDDSFVTNYFPLMRIRAVDRSTGEELAHTDIVVPVSQEVDCQTCHVNDAIAADDPGVFWSRDLDPERQAKMNILILHDRNQGTDLVNDRPVLCASCHYSPALDLAGNGPTGSQVGVSLMSAAMHSYHGNLIEDGQPVFPTNAPVEESCYLCHPGEETQCHRGAMKTGGMECLDCHGNMQAVGGDFNLAAGGSLDGLNDGAPRRPWTDLPRCGSCHTGDALDHLVGQGTVAAPDGIRLLQAWRNGDPASSAILPTNTRFTEEFGNLYRQSRGHAQLLCMDCHGSPHAIWPNDDFRANDNVAAFQLQGHRGTITECSTCHAEGTLPPTMGGPHGMHNVADEEFTDHEHEEFWELDSDSCRSCHGQNLQGTVLSRAAADRIFQIEDDPVTFAAGEMIGCMHCHGMPSDEDDDSDDE